MLITHRAKQKLYRPVSLPYFNINNIYCDHKLLKTILVSPCTANLVLTMSITSDTTEFLNTIDTPFMFYGDIDKIYFIALEME